MMADIERFMYCLQDYNITHIVLVPSLLRAMLDVISFRMKLNGLQLPKLNHWVTSGEPLSFALAQQFFSVFPSGKALYNFYGSTEVMGDVTYEEFLNADDVVKKSLDGVMSIGEPITNTAVYLVDENLQLFQLGMLENSASAV
jgi:surfactin family lipopeptide synthetase C